MATKTKDGFSRRTFVKGSAALGALAAAAGGSALAAQTFTNAPKSALADGGDTIAWSQCTVNCGGDCVFQWHATDGKITYMESDNTGDVNLQARACLRGRSERKWINSPDRLLHPMKRADGAKRGEGKFEQISWDEAIQLIHDKLEYTIKTYGNDAVYVHYGTGMHSTTGNASNRLINLLGGGLNQAYDYSTHMLSAVMPYMFGSDPTKGSVFSPYDATNASSMTEAAANSDLLIMFGNSPAETRMGGANIVWDFARTREAIKERGGKIVNIDYRLNETSSSHPDEWLPIRTGTDAALVAAIAHELIKDGKVDLDFLHTYCIGYDEQTMPASAKGQNKSYYDYIMGSGYDKVEKTPEWAAPITQVPADRIRSLVKDIEGAKAMFVCQGWGPQRHSNGETATRAICMLPLLTGQFGLPGTNTGQREAEPPVYLVGSIDGLWEKSTVTATIPVFEWLNAIDHGDQMTATNAGITGADKLKTGIKFLWNYAGNCLTNQHGDINKVDEVLKDETKCEFILVWDTVMTDSAKYADLLLPDAMRSEQLNMYTQGYSEWYTGVTVGGPAQAAPGECRPSYDVLADIADKFGLKQQFTEGKTQEQWIEEQYKAGAAADTGGADGSKMPTWEQIQAQGVYKRALPTVVGLKDFRDDPKKHPVGTPSGKIEIYSEALQKIADTWELGEGEVISPIPIFDPGLRGYGTVTDEFPLYCAGFHHKSRTHSSFGFIEDLEKVARQQVWINPADATPRGIADQDMVSVKTAVGEIQIEAKVTPRIVPGTIGIPQGAWHNADMDGDKVDKGACINTLTTYAPTPLAKGNGVHSNIAQVTKL
jgi:Tat-targeted selenate reductase subunit YnfE/Tat-targeted selenate reductase subunit YnfF